MNVNEHYILQLGENRPPLGFKFLAWPNKSETKTDRTPVNAIQSQAGKRVVVRGRTVNRRHIMIDEYVLLRFLISENNLSAWRVDVPVRSKNKRAASVSHVETVLVEERTMRGF